MDIDAVVQERLDNDTDFQATLATLTDEEKPNAIAVKRSEVIKTEFESLSKKAQDNEQKFQDQKTRAEKAEILAKQGKKEDKVDSSITAKDVLILTSAGVAHDEDIELIEKWAQFNKLSIKDALADGTLKSVLATKQEERKTAQATQTRGGQRGSATPTADVILADASKGRLPENDAEIQRLADARMEKKLGK